MKKHCFIITHKYYRGYTSYLQHYIDNINKFYTDSLIIVVDNNSTHKNDIFNNLINCDNVVLLDNNIDCKFEAGAYTVGLNYIIKNNIIYDYEYYVFTQDTFILKNKLEFNDLLNSNVLACPITWGMGTQDFPISVIGKYLSNLGINANDFEMNNNYPFIENDNIPKDVLTKILHCYSNSFITHNSKIIELLTYLSKITITNRLESEHFERYFAWVLFILNGNKNHQIDFNPYRLYDRKKINLHDDFTHGFFAKHQQVKNENTKDK